MEQATILSNHYNIYWETTQLNNKDLNNKLFCTFVTEDVLDEMVSSISSTYTIMYNKMFVLFVKSTNEYVITYNVDQGNVSNIPLNTILVHRKKETNTLYTINALNELIRELNNGYLDIMYKINWVDYKNCVILIRDNMLYKINTKIYNIIHTND